MKKLVLATVACAVALTPWFAEATTPTPAALPAPAPSTPSQPTLRLAPPPQWVDGIYLLAADRSGSAFHGGVNRSGVYDAIWVDQLVFHAPAPGDRGTFVFRKPADSTTAKFQFALTSHQPIRMKFVWPVHTATQTLNAQVKVDLVNVLSIQSVPFVPRPNSTDTSATHPPDEIITAKIFDPAAPMWSRWPTPTSPTVVSNDVGLDICLRDYACTLQ